MALSLGGFSSGNNKNLTLEKQKDLNTGIGITTGVAIINPFAWIGVSDMKKKKNAVNSYIGNIDLLTQYSNQLSQIAGDMVGAENIIFEYEGRIQDLNRAKAESEEYMEDYRQMLAGRGDSDNLLLLEDRINQANLANARADLAAYRDSSALELDSMIRSGFEEYVTARDQEAIANVYASATGSVVGAFNSAAKRTRFAIRTFVGDDMVFDQEADGTSIYGKSGASIGTFAQMMLSSRQTIRNNIAKLQTQIDAANLAYLSFRDQAADIAEENQIFLDDYDKTLANYESNLNAANSMLDELQTAAEEYLQKGEELIGDVNKYEQQQGWEESEWTWGPSERTQKVTEAISDLVNSFVGLFQ